MCCAASTGCADTRGRWLTALVGLFMLVNMVVSGLALIRSDARSNDIPPANALDVFLDEHFPDERMSQIYPSAKKPENAGIPADF